MSRHRKLPARTLAVSAFLASAAVGTAVALASPASAAVPPGATLVDAQPALASPDTSGAQPGLASPDTSGAQPGLASPAPTPEPAPAVPDGGYAAAPLPYDGPAPVITQNPGDSVSPAASSPSTSDGSGTTGGTSGDGTSQSTPAPAPIQLNQLHAPTPTPKVAPKEPPHGKVRIGSEQTDKPDWMPQPVANTINADSAVASADLNNAFNSIGIPQGDSARIAATTVAGVAGGALVAGAPAAVAGGLIGGTIGGLAGAGVGTTVLLPIGPVTSGVIGTAAGTAIGAAVAGAPAALVGGTVGGLTGAVFGAANPTTDVNSLPELPIPGAHHDGPTTPAPVQPGVTPAAPGRAPVTAAQPGIASAAPVRVAPAPAPTSVPAVRAASAAVSVTAGERTGSAGVDVQSTGPAAATVTAHTDLGSGAPQTVSAHVDASPLEQAGAQARTAVAAAPGGAQVLRAVDAAAARVQQAAASLPTTLGPVHVDLAGAAASLTGSVRR